MRYRYGTIVVTLFPAFGTCLCTLCNKFRTFAEGNSESYIIGTQVGLTAQPAGDSVFAGWSGNCSGTAATCNVTLDDVKNVTATFSLKTFALSITKSGDGNGTITSAPNGISCGEDCTQDYTIGTSVTLTAQPDNESIFAGWEGACTGTLITCEVSIDDAVDVNAIFESDSQLLLLPLIMP